MSKMRGFTIVELMVTIAVLSLLTGISIFFLNGWRERTVSNAIKHELESAYTALQSAKNFSNGYPAALSPTYQPGDSVTMQYTLRTNGSYCLNAAGADRPTIKFYIDSTIGNEPKEGTCS